MDMVKLSVFLPPQSEIGIPTLTFCLPSQIIILFEIQADMLGKNSTHFFQHFLSVVNSTLQSPPVSTLHNRKNKIE